MGGDLVGSSKLKKSLPYGAMLEMAKTFDKSNNWIGKVIAGTHQGNPAILECAFEIAKFHKKNNVELKQILKKYVGTNN